MSNVPKSVDIKELNDFTSYRDVELVPYVRKSATVLYGMFTEVLRQAYTEEVATLLGCPTKIWRPDVTTTDIWIDTELRWEDEAPEFRPAIYVQLGPIQYASLTGRKDAYISTDYRGRESYSRSGTGEVAFIHIANSSNEACFLADNTYNYLDAFSKVIRDDFCFTYFTTAGRHPKRRREKEAKEKFDSVVTCSYMFEDTWTLVRESPILKTVLVGAGHQTSNIVK